MSALPPVVAMLLGLAAVLYAIWPMLRGRPEPLASEPLIDPGAEADLTRELERWSERAGEIATRADDEDRPGSAGEPRGSAGETRGVAGPGAGAETR